MRRESVGRRKILANDNIFSSFFLLLSTLYLDHFHREYSDEKFLSGNSTKEFLLIELEKCAMRNKLFIHQGYGMLFWTADKHFSA